MVIALLILRFVAGVAGALLLYAGLFLRENEERDVENVLELWWIRIDDLKRAAIQRHVAITVGAVGLARQALDRLFGTRIWSIRAAATAACLSFVSLHITTSVLYHEGMAFIEHVDPQKVRPEDAVGMLLQVIFWGGAAVFVSLTIPTEPVMIQIPSIAAGLTVLLASVSARLRDAPLAGVIFCWSFLGTLWLLPFVGMDPHVVSGPFIDITALGIGFDILAIAAIRALMKRQSETLSFGKLAVLALCQLVLAISLLVGPVLLGVGIAIFVALPLGSLVIAVLAWEVALSSVTNLLAASVCAALFAAAALLGMHRLVWPVLERPLYRVARFGVFRHPLGRPLLLSLGAATLAVAADGSDAVVALILRLLGSA